jgi:hypothetical protein
MQILINDYVVEMGFTGSCSFCISERKSATIWILGDAFMRNFYVIADMTNARQGIVPLA